STLSLHDALPISIALRVVADVRGTRHAGDHLHLLPALVRGHGGIGPARHQDPRAGDHDTVEPSSAPGDDLGGLVPRLPRKHRLGRPEGHDDEPLTDWVYGDPVRPA